MPIRRRRRWCWRRESRRAGRTIAIADQWLFVVAGSGTATVNGKRYSLKAGTLMLIERGNAHEIRNSGRGVLRALSIYVPPAYTAAGEELPRGKP
jgi:mannose-6-phosphate isomerase-like protein (cupin superfamily)